MCGRAGSDALGQAAAALASISLVFKSVDAPYSAMLLANAAELLRYAGSLRWFSATGRTAADCRTQFLTERALHDYSGPSMPAMGMASRAGSWQPAAANSCSAVLA